MTACLLSRVDFSETPSRSATSSTDQSMLPFDTQPISRAADVRQSDSLPGAIASYLSHDIRHHLSTIYCSAEFLTQSTGPEGAELAQDIYESIRDITDILDFVLCHAPRHSPLREEMESFEDLIEQRVQAVRMHPSAQGVCIDVETTASPLKARLNRTVVGSAIYNVLLNACHAAQRSPEAGIVKVSLREDREVVCIDITDNGPGVSAEVRQNLFQPYVTSGKERGLGLGTTLADYAARAYGGCLALARSRPGRTTFVLSFAKAVLWPQPATTP